MDNPQPRSTTILKCIRDEQLPEGIRRLLRTPGQAGIDTMVPFAILAGSAITEGGPFLEAIDTLRSPIADIAEYTRQQKSWAGSLLRK